MYPVVRLETLATGCGFPGDRTALVAGRILIPKPSGKKEKRKVSTAIGLSEDPRIRQQPTATTFVNGTANNTSTASLTITAH
jgi:hypothetical protein